MALESHVQGRVTHTSCITAVRGLPAGMVIRAPYLTTAVGRALSPAGVTVGDPEVDAAVVFEGTNESLVRTWIARPGMRTTVLELVRAGASVHRNDLTLRKIGGFSSTQQIEEFVAKAHALACQLESEPPASSI